jgi:hypothetical protein
VENSHQPPILDEIFDRKETKRNEMKDKFDDEAASRLELNFDGIISAAAYSVRYLTKLSQISFEGTALQELTVHPAKATTDYKKTVVIREPSVMDCRFQDLPVS